MNEDSTQGGCENSREGGPLRVWQEARWGKAHLHIPDAHAAIHAGSTELQALGLTPTEHRDLAAERMRVLWIPACTFVGLKVTLPLRSSWGHQYSWKC